MDRIVDELFDPPVPRDELVHPQHTVNATLKSDIVKPAEHMLENTKASLGTDPIPAARYFSKEWAEKEKISLWTKVWQMASWGEDIRNPGDIYVYRILDRSVLVIRQRDGSVRAFVNACLHRGLELCEQHTHQAELKCPFHFFTWGLDGDVKWVPSRWDFPQLEQGEPKLPEVRCEEWNGFYFINFDKSAESLKDYLGSRFLEQWKDWDFSKRYKAAQIEKRIKCNWKTGQDAFMESLHAFSTHPQSNGGAANDTAQYDIWPDSPNINRMITTLGISPERMDPRPTEPEVFEWICSMYLPDVLGTEEGKLKSGETARDGSAWIARKAYSQNFGVDCSNLSASEALDAISYFIFPNMMPWGCLSFPLVYRFRPDESGDPDWCIWEAMLLLPYSGERPPSGPVIKVGPDESFESIIELGQLAMILQQDADLLPGTQRGMKNLADGKLILTESQELRNHPAWAAGLY
jgi:phenylpropionate dioxygenase-like ring-hydroxylating dioxygenase large terminal subunit